MALVRPWATHEGYIEHRALLPPTLELREVRVAYTYGDCYEHGGGDVVDGEALALVYLGDDVPYLCGEDACREGRVRER